MTSCCTRKGYIGRKTYFLVVDPLLEGSWPGPDGDFCPVFWCFFFTYWTYWQRCLRSNIFSLNISSVAERPWMVFVLFLSSQCSRSHRNADMPVTPTDCLSIEYIIKALNKNQTNICTCAASKSMFQRSWSILSPWILYKTVPTRTKLLKSKQFFPVSTQNFEL